MRVMEVMGQRTNPSQGLGRLAKAIVGFNHRVPNLKVVAVDTPRNADVVVYCRKSEATLKQATEYCSSTGAALIFLSSGLQINKLDTSRYPFIRVPNSALTVINYLSLVETQAKDRFADWVPKIIEHHQVSKADVSGTAKKLADMLGVEYDMIESIREFERTKKQYNIPKSSQDGYAVHSVTFTDPITGLVS